MSENENETQREAKNAIFSSQENIMPGVPMVSREEQAQKDLGIEFVTATVPLPSRGLVYPAGHPLHCQEYVDIKGMTAKEEDILMSRTFIKKGTVITELIKSSLKDPTIDVSSMISGDRNALMVAIRITGYGADYRPMVKCPSCEVQKEILIDLSNLEIKPLELQPKSVGLNSFEFRLPVSGKVVEFKFLTGKEEEEIIAAMEMKKKKGIQNDNVITTRFQYQLLSIDGNRDRNLINKFASYMAANDSRALRKYVDQHEPGIDMKFEFNCESCDHLEVMAVPMSAAFFWPGN